VNREELLRQWGALRAELDAAHVRLLAVSKYAPDEAVRCLIAAGQMDFGESRPQGLRDRAQAFSNVRWHMIGPLQKNKARYIGRYAAMWHSVEDMDAARAVAAHVRGRRLPVLLQVNIAGRSNQHGVDPARAPAMLEQLLTLPELKVRGLMCMAPGKSDARACFRALRILRDHLMHGSLRPSHDVSEDASCPLELCMGMSGDYAQAIAEGATMVRLGSILFGESCQA